MGYTPTIWTTGDTITTTKLNKMEQGIAGAGSVLVCNSTFSNNQYVLDKTAGEIYEALLAGTPVYIKFQYGTTSNYSGTLSFANVIRFSNYNYTSTIDIYACKANFATVSGNVGSGVSAMIRYTAGGLDEYPYENGGTSVKPASLDTTEGEY